MAGTPCLSHPSVPAPCHPLSALPCPAHLHLPLPSAHILPSGHCPILVTILCQPPAPLHLEVLEGEKIARKEGGKEGGRKEEVGRRKECSEEREKPAVPSFHPAAMGSLGDLGLGFHTLKVWERLLQLLSDFPSGSEFHWSRRQVCGVREGGRCLGGRGAQRALGPGQRMGGTYAPLCLSPPPSPRDLRATPSALHPVSHHQQDTAPAWGIGVSGGPLCWGQSGSEDRVDRG